MTTAQLYIFIHRNDLEIDWRGEELILCIRFPLLRAFTQLLGYNSFDEGGIGVWLRSDSIALDLVQLCEDEGIDPCEIHPFDAADR